MKMFKAVGRVGQLTGSRGHSSHELSGSVFRTPIVVALAISSFAITCSPAWAACATSSPESRATTLARLSAPGDPHESVAHRGLFASDTPSLQLSENTPAAIREAVCNGYEAVEIDIKVTSDLQPIMLHDDSPSRTTNVEPATINDYNYLTQRNGEARNIYYPIPDRYRPRNATSRKINTYTRAEFLGLYSSDKVFDKDGFYQRNVPVASATKNRVFLADFLEWTKTDSILDGSGVFVLDIQDFDTLKATYQVVRNTNTFDRVIFKVWTNALPVYVGFTGQGPSYSFDTFALFDGDAGQGYWVYSINSLNARRTSDSSGEFEVRFLQTTDANGNRAGFTPKTIYLPYHVTNNNAKDANAVLSAVRRDASLGIPGQKFLGFETFISAKDGDQAIDAYIAARRNDGFRNTYYGRTNIEKTWGVKRSADFLQTNCAGYGFMFPRYLCPSLPNGGYSAGTDLLTLIPDNIRTTRNNFGVAADIIINDISR